MLAAHPPKTTLADKWCRPIPLTAPTDLPTDVIRWHHLRVIATSTSVPRVATKHHVMLTLANQKMPKARQSQNFVKNAKMCHFRSFLLGVFTWPMHENYVETVIRAPVCHPGQHNPASCSAIHYPTCKITLVHRKNTGIYPSPSAKPMFLVFSLQIISVRAKFKNRTVC